VSYDPMPWLHANPLLVKVVDEMIASYERSLRRQYLADACRMVGDHDGELAMNVEALRLYDEAESSRRIVGMAVATAQGYHGYLKFPRPRLTHVEDLVAGIRYDPWN
jgi:hypothetical protein